MAPRTARATPPAAYAVLSGQTSKTLAVVEALRQLARAVGRPEDDASFADGHDRWSLYRAALDTSAALPPLFEAVSLEPDGPLASAVVGEVLERVPEDERERWVRILPPADSVAELIDGWSDWLQGRAVHVTADQDVLSVVSRRGRTRRIRQAAVDALRQR
ncbi:hypothetical protein ACFYZ2_11785 [Streptomyces sviceus]|uniref:hypothetical protein n=1 Tax=Streptomyces sviceus TaxID=285530 RepID=UPI0036B129EA